MTNAPGFRNRCPHCGYWLPPNKPGPCPNCGRDLHTVLLTTAGEKKEGWPIEVPVMTASGERRVFKLTFNETVGIREKISEVVNASGAMAFNATHSTLPQNWSDIADMITNKVTSKLPEILPPILEPVLEKHEREREARENSLPGQIKRVINDVRNPATWFWIVVSTIAGSIVVYLIFGHT